MSLGGRGRLLAGVFALFSGLLAALGAHTLVFTVRTEGSDVVVETCGKTFRGDLGGAAPLEVRYYPQERFSTEQVFRPDRGLLLDGLVFLVNTGRKRPDEPIVFRQEPGQTRRYVLFDPFRGAVTVHRGAPELRLEVNVPDDALESWQAGGKTGQAKMSPPWLRLTFAPLFASLFLAGLLACLAALLPRSGAEAPPPPAGAHRFERVLPFAVFLLGAALSAAVFHLAFRAMPGFGDEMNYLMEGRILASGHLSVPEPPHPEFFRVNWMDMFGADGKVWGFHPPGQSALLALGWLFGLPWLTVPLVFGGILTATYLLAREVLGSAGWALVNVAVVATSHYVVSLSNSYMAHAPSYLCLALYLLFLLRFARTGRGGFLLLAAAAAGAAFCMRPLSAVLASLVPLPAVLVAARKKASPRTWGLALLVGLAVSSLVFFYTRGITGRFTLPYAIKGPEVGQTVWVRLTKGWTVHETNLFRNVDEFQHRVHGFGLLGNTVFFFLPLALAAVRRRLGAPLALLYATFGSFVLAHSVLHWYGWKWEPRMLFDVSFLFFLGTTAGLRSFGALLPAGGARRAAAAALGLAFLFAAGRDLPWRLTHEYQDYNQAPVGVRDAIAKQGIRNAVIFFGGEKAYACYTPYNSVAFDGDVVYARVQGELLDYLLLERFPGKEAWFTPDGNTLQRRPNFYRKDLATLKGDLDRLGGGPAAVVMPWLSVAPTPLNEKLKPAAPEDPGRFLGRLAAGGSDAPREAVFLEGAAELARLADLSFETETPKTAGTYEGPVAFRTIGKRRPGAGGSFPGIWMTCREGTTWDGKILSEQLVSTLDIGVCPGENRSITFETSFALKASRRCVFTTESDDGSGVFVDGALVLDNDLTGTHGPETKSGTVVLGPGVHNLLVKYFNGPGGARLSATLEDREGRKVPISVAGFLDEFHFFVTRFAKGAPEAAHGR